MRNSKILDAMKQSHLSTPTTDLPGGSNIFVTEGYTQITFQSIGCQPQKEGSCIMCAYGRGSKNLSPVDASKVFSRIPQEDLRSVVILGTFGSILDEAEMPLNTFTEILSRVAGIFEFETVIFETRPETITPEKIKQIKQVLRKDQQVGFEIGVETYDQDERRNKLGKNLTDRAILNTIRLAHDNGCFALANVLIGVPFLSVGERIRQAHKTCEWLFENDIDEVVLFPVNIKPGTPLYDLYRSGDYRPVSHWEVIMTLTLISFNKQDLARTSLAYYGNRTDGKPPIQCEYCEQTRRFQDFYREFLYGETDRSTLVKDIGNKDNVPPKCTCYNDFRQSLSH